MVRTGAWLRGLPRDPAAVAMAVLVIVSFAQRPGRTTFDTKLDLTADPIAFMVRSLHLWNPENNAGELQNQAYGYLFPIGPFFAACQSVGIPDWVTQRLWCALLLCVAFGGMLKLARALNIGHPAARLVAAFAYALAPRMLTEIGPISAELLPAVMMPWILLPLVRANRIKSPRRAAGLSAVAVMMIGGVNAAMVVMALVLPGVWLVTRVWTAAHVRLVAWWTAFVAAVCLWWVLPLLLLGEYSLPFLDYIESSTNTTAPVSLFQALRGTNQWVAYVVQGEPWWPAGYLLVDRPLLILGTGLVAAVALGGLVRHHLPERLFLVTAVVVGLTLLTVGYVGTLGSPAGEYVRSLLDGPLAPLRNVHKFEPVLRLPLMLAFCHAVSGRLPAALNRGTSTIWARRARLGVGVALVIVVSAPAWLFTLRPGPGWTEIPDHWREAMVWLRDHDSQARTMLLPATAFGEYTWGRTVDEPAQALAEAPWAVRSQIPLGSEGNTRLMDTVEDTLANGRGSPALAGFLARAGFRYVMLRNDIDRTSDRVPPISVLRAGLRGSPGLSRVATFGPDIDPAALTGARLLDRTGDRVPTLEVYEVDQPPPVAQVVAERDVAAVAGGPESLLPLIDVGLLEQDRPAILVGDKPPTDRALVTDGLRRRERNVGAVRDNLGNTLAPDDPSRFGRPSLDLLPFPGAEYQTTAAYRGIRRVTASTSAGFADSVGPTDPSLQPFFAVDGDLTTAWNSSSYTGPTGQWLEVELDTPLTVDEISLAIVDDLSVGWPVTAIRITTDSGSVDREFSRGGESKSFRTAGGLTRKVRITVLGVAADRDNGNVGIRELTIPGVTATRALQVPPVQGPTAAFAFTRGSLPRYPCVADESHTTCDRSLTRLGEEPSGVHRLFRSTDTANFRVEGTVLPAFGGTVPVTSSATGASSWLGGDPAVAPLAAVDDDEATTWIADPTDEKPTLKLAWPTQRRITGIQLRTDARSQASRPVEVDLRTPTGRVVRAALDGSGRATVDLTTDRLDLVITGAERGRPLPVGITELSLDGAPMAPVSADADFELPCGKGPAITVDGLTYPTSVKGTLADLRAHRSLPFATCRDLAEGLDLAAGRHELRTAPTPEFVVHDVSLRPSTDSSAGPRTRSTKIEEWGAAERSMTVGPGDKSVLVVPENGNAGWVATLDGAPLLKSRVDGWQQAWLVPAGAGGRIELAFTPDRQYRQALLIGAVVLLVALVLIALPVRRRVDLDSSPGRHRWIQVLLVGFIALLGGMLAFVILIAVTLVRTLWPPAPRFIAPGAAAAAAVTATTGRMLGYGQDWAYGWVAQSLLVLAVCAAVTACLEWPAQPTEESPG